MDENPNGDIVRRTAEKYHRKFLPYVRTFLDPDDMAQEIALKLIAKGLFDSAERALVRHAAKKICLDMLREAVPGFRRREILPPPHSIDDPSTSFEAAAGRSTDAAEDLRRQLYSCDGALDGREKAVIMGQVEGLTQSEIAEQLGVTQQRVWAIRQRALVKLRLSMGGAKPE